ncbi:MAG: AAA family ATPase, partial [Halanaerobium sp.]|nr:AAA family ATPase [Halanaerobium sp.]
MVRNKTHYICQSCGHTTLKWYGRCPNCGTWNSMVEETPAEQERKASFSGPRAEVQPIASIATNIQGRFSTRMAEMDRVLGGGIVPGSLILIGGDPGIGKSTLLMQIGALVGEATGSVLYISGEESPRQLKIRATRLAVGGSSFLVCSEVNVLNIEQIIREEEPALVIIDSIQTLVHPDLNSAPGSISQIREATNVFLRVAKGTGIPVFLVGHVTKGGAIAGPKALEHMVDTVLYL